MSKICYWQIAYAKEWLATHETLRDFSMGFYVEQRKKGDRNIHFCDGNGLLPFSTDAAFVDGVHPTDEGFRTMAERVAPVIRFVLADKI